MDGWMDEEEKIKRCKVRVHKEKWDQRKERGRGEEMGGAQVCEGRRGGGRGAQLGMRARGGAKVGDGIKPDGRPG